jgi:hypothetical protein
MNLEYLLFFTATQEVIKPANNYSFSNQAFGKIRASLWYIGHVAFSFSGAWDARIRPNTLPTSETYLTKTKAIANDTYFSSLSGLPTP